MNPALADPKRDREGEMLRHRDMLEDARLNIREQLDSIDWHSGRHHLPMRLEEIVGLSLKAARFNRLLEQLHRSLVFFGYETELLCILQRR